MNDDHIVSIAQLGEMLKLTKDLSAGSCDTLNNKYEWIGRTLGKFKYFSLKKKERSTVKTYLKEMTGYSDSRIDKLIKRKKTLGTVKPATRTQNKFGSIYTSADIKVLAELANDYHHQNGCALKKICSDMYHLYGDDKYSSLCNISVAHIYNLKKTNVYKTTALHYTKTNPTKVAIGERRKPAPWGKPGYVRVDSVHQGDLDKQKGVYHINMVDEVTQMEFIGCVEKISEYFLEPLLEQMLELFPFVIINFHSDNGSEYINHTVAALLNKLMIDQTKSRSRKTNDNALVEGKNAAVVRKIMGHAHIPQKHAPVINQFYRDYMDDFINYHRPCAYPTDTVDARGKIKKKYETYLVPIQRLLSLPKCEQYFAPGITRDILEAKLKIQSHTASASAMRAAKQKLFASFSSEK